MRDDPLPQVEEALALLQRAIEKGIPLDAELLAILQELEALTPVLRGQEWGKAVQR